MRAANKNSKRYEVLAEIRKDPRASYRELMERVGLHSLSVISYHIEKLQEEGLVTKERYLSRSLDLADGRSRVQKRLGTVRRNVDQRKHSDEKLNKKRAEAGRFEKPAGAFVPRKTKNTDALQQRIEKVVARAHEQGQLGSGSVNVPEYDVIHHEVYRVGSLRGAHKIG